MKKIILYTFATLWLGLTTGCIDTYEAQVGDAGEGCLVVEGNIVSDATVTFYLSRTFGLNIDFLPSDYNHVDAEVAVVGSDGARWTGTKVDNGAYEVAVGSLKENETYSLEVKYDGDTYTSEPQKPLPTTEISELAFTQEGTGDVEIKLSSAAANPDEAEYYFWNYVEDWEIQSLYSCRYVYEHHLDSVVAYASAPYDQGWAHNESSTILIGTTESTLDNRLEGKRIYSIPSDDNRISFYYSTLMVQRNLTKGEYEYYQSRKKYSEDMGGLFTPQPSELPTNIVCSNKHKVVVGYVGCNMNVSRKRIYIPVEDINYTRRSKCSEVEFEQSYEYMYQQGCQIIDYWTFGGLSLTWGKRECVDVRAWGADPSPGARPDWWPLKERTF